MSGMTTDFHARGSKRARRLALIGGVVSLLALPAAASANPSNISTGKAYDLALKTSLLGTLVTAGPVVGPISSNTTTHTTQSAVNVFTSLANASALTASVDTTNEGAKSTAQVAGANTFIPGLPTINAKVLTAQATATCRNHGTVLASSVGGTITVNGTTTPIASPPNTTIPLGLLGSLGSVTVNEQIKTGNSLVVNAIHVRTVLGTELVIASAQAGVSNCV